MSERLFDVDTRRSWQRSSLPDPTTPLTGAAHEHSTDTERAAAALVAPRSGSLRYGALVLIQESGNEGMTGHEVAEHLNALLYSVMPRLTELRDAGWIADSERRRITPSGALAIVWVLSERGRAELA